MATIFQLYASPAGEHKETKRDSVLQRLLDAQPPHGQVSSQFILVVDFTSDQGVQDTYQLPKISSISKSIIFLKMTLCILQRHTIPIDKWEFLVTLSKIQFLKKENLLFGSWASPLSQGGSHFSTWMS